MREVTDKEPTAFLVAIVMTINAFSRDISRIIFENGDV